MLKRDQRFIPEKHRIGVIGYIRATGMVLLCCLAAFGIVVGAKNFFYSSIAPSAVIISIDPIKDEWKRRPEDPEGIDFLNKGLEINRVQAELFDVPVPEQIVLAPPPDDF